MAGPIDAEALVQDILSALSGVLQEDIKAHVQFAEQQARSLAMSAALITEATIRQQITAEDREFFLRDLALLTENFARTVAALTILTIEKAWNAVVNAIWGAINTALDGLLGAAIPLPSAPRA